MKFLTNPDELNTILHSPRLLVLDARSFSKYLKCHIPGAVNIDLFQFHWIDTSKVGIKEFEHQSRELLSNIGLKNNLQVVFYDDISGMSAARGVWLLHFFSHRNVSMLDGGFLRWQHEGYPVESKTNPFFPTAFFGKLNRKVLSRFAEVKNSLNKKDTVIVDARTKEEFSGQHVRGARAGHIPSAINVDWQQNIDNGIFKSPEQLQKFYPNIPKNSKIITYCQGGYRAANTYLALKILGYKDVRMYLGSWGEWGNKLDLPIEQSK